jgi:hypothetical protein
MAQPTQTPFSRYRAKDPDMDRIVQDIYDKLQQAQAQLATQQESINKLLKAVFP